MKIKTLFRVMISTIKMSCLKIRHIRNFTFNGLSSCSLSTEIRIEKGGLLEIGRHFSALRYTLVSVRKDGKLTIGDNLNMNDNCSIVAHNNISIGNNVIMGPGCHIYDHDHDYEKKGLQRRMSFVNGNVVIGSGVWFGANCIVLKNTEIGDNCVFGAGSIIKGKFEADSLVTQELNIRKKKIEYNYSE